MSGQPVAQLREGKFEAEAYLEPSVVVAKMAGSADVVSQKQLSTFLTTVDGVARTEKVLTVRVDLTALDFVNSTSMGVFAQWFSTLGAADDAPYAVVLSFRNVLHRPRRAFAGMLALFPFVKLEP